MNELISIISPSYNSSKFISASIESVLNQTYNNWELIIIDDLSTDNSNKIIEKYTKRDNRIKLIKLKKNTGPATARNIGIKEANRRYIAFLDSDDMWLSNKLEKQISFMKDNDVYLCYSSYYIIDENKNIKSIFNIPKIKIDYNDLLKSNIIGNLTAIYDTKKIGKLYMKNVGHEDYTLWLKILRKIDYAYGINEPLAKYTLHSNSISSNKLKSAYWQWKIYRKNEKLNFQKSIYYFIHYCYNGIVKY